jgi:Flp pilus assembly pilin Flp
MKRMITLVNDTSGTTSIEYAAIASVLSIVIVTAAGAIGSTVSAFFHAIPSF